MTTQTMFYDLVEKLSDERKGMIYRIALDLLSAQQTEDFDTFSPDEVKGIVDARKRMFCGDCMSFSSAEDMAAYFAVTNQ